MIGKVNSATGAAQRKTTCRECPNAWMIPFRIAAGSL
jgi:hypothetical protein